MTDDPIRAASSQWLRENEKCAIDLIMAYRFTKYTIRQVLEEKTDWTDAQMDSMSAYITMMLMDA